MKLSNVLIGGAALLATASVASAHDANITWMSHQGGKSYQACQDGGAGMAENTPYTVASDNGVNTGSLQSWDYSTVGFVSVNNPTGKKTNITATIQIGSQTACGAGPNDCYQASTTTFVVPGHSTVMIPWSKFIVNEPPFSTEAFYMLLTPNRSGLVCMTQSYETTEHDGDN